jgi:hypothetical protein
MASRGQPTQYTPELADEICRLISTSPKSLHDIIKENNLPTRETIYNWLRKYDDFFHNYMQAKQNQAHVLVDEMLILHKEIPVYNDKEGNPRIDNGMLGRSRLQMDTLRWCAANLAPKWYGDSKQKEVVNSEVDEDCKKRMAEMDAKNRKDC